MIINGGCTYTTADGQQVDYSQDITADSAKHKYGGDPMAEYLDHCDGEDEWTGDPALAWDVHARRFGKRILCTDDRGFVWVTKFATEDEAKSEFEAIEQAYGEWLDQDEDSV